MQKNIDKTVSDFVFNTTGKRYEFEFIEPDITAFKESRNNIEASLTKSIIEENAKRVVELENEKLKEKKAKEKIEK